MADTSKDRNRARCAPNLRCVCSASVERECASECARMNLTASSRGRPAVRFAGFRASRPHGKILPLSLSLGWPSSHASLSVLNGAEKRRREESPRFRVAAARHWNARILETRNDLPPRPVIGQSRRDAAVCESNAAI